MTQAAAEQAISQRSEAVFRLFALYLRWYASRHFHAVRLSRTGRPAVAPGRPLIVYSNHPSWWDPAVYILLGRALFPGRPGWGPMAAAALGKYGVLGRVGVFGLPPGAPGAALFLRAGMAALARPGGMLWVTAEGAFTDSRTRPLHLQPGLAHLARRVPGAIILPLALEYTFWDESRPEALARFGTPVAAADASVTGWTDRLEAALTCTMDALAAESRTRDPALFTPLLRGHAGVGGPYDAWRWLRAAASGRRFDPSHGGEA